MRMQGNSLCKLVAPLLALLWCCACVGQPHSLLFRSGQASMLAQALLAS
jgi:hypothetical protein